MGFGTTLGHISLYDVGQIFSFWVSQFYFRLLRVSRHCFGIIKIVFWCFSMGLGTALVCKCWFVCRFFLFSFTFRSVQSLCL